MIYPDTRRTDTVEEHFGTAVVDPYRWLEGDARGHVEVADWVRAQDALARAYLARLPGRDHFRRRLAELFDHARLTAPEKRGERYFFTRNPGLENQAVLLVREGPHGADRVLLDPNPWSDDGATALAEWAVSADGRSLAFATQEAGSDWRTIRVLDVESGDTLPDVLAWARFTTLAWARDGSGFFYARFPAPPEGNVFDAPVTDHSIYFHVLGTSQAEDRLVRAPPTGQLLIQTVSVTPDGRYAVIASTPGAGGNALAIIDLQDPNWTPRPLIQAYDHNWSVVGNQGTRLFLATDDGAERGKIVTLDLAATEPRFVELIAEREDGTLNDAALLGGHLLVTYLVDAKTEIRRHRLDGTPDGTVALPGLGTAGGFRGRPDDDEAFFVFTGHNAPTTIYRYAVARRLLTIWDRPEVAIDLERIVVEQRFYASKDGTRVPMFVVRRADLQTPAPTLLYGYGGYGISMVPYYSPAVLAWVEAGGVYAVANLRGGGEYGKAWHDAGRLANKQNVFDDFIAAAEYLKREGIASAEGLAIQGESNGGLLVAAVVNQRPELFAAALPGVGVLDMLRFARFTNGQFWIGDYGDPEKEADFRNLLSYSPYHTIRSGRAYPALLVTTADTDDRVVPAHSFKYVAALQSADLGDRPRLLRVDTRAGHGAGKPIGKALDELADLWAFAARWTGLAVEAAD
ncbi:prolyl oligopeptidase family serine peptidase [Archangium primigenium]|uniref:prolyl oligopeptidase family serine peptidase n=1 Tax=[Archangium] primigenium TaxID=2792470 RepID=UPI0019591EE9|nr:prolyl oligopeptidase family serine peptidase [Archangium primigenium]MBM7116642.1 S9 family peptidase [Archangium primigenium]